ncbi:adenylate kinase [Acidimicrobium ferrooxidans DSM 10331]|uniref:Adenylate kinase n=1 Tax=Acidimicrobium ferrooxidans (strain DSM 10331 / JCM 15462 / NBRC 103882 / ICP) TaxID=525909 RepID=C7M2Z3_ACIFD|nr:adenylate kinase [Acidimicrobium ferrooxidans]ACU53387.1 adenylate kinase [Acidimicrobium ferrooxidans DSM 10331]
MGDAALRLALLGRQGAGKGTQAVRISHHFAIAHIATGDILRAAVRAGTPFGEKAKAYLDRGELVPDAVIIGVVAERLSEADATRRGFVLDGFPRTVEQAEALEGLLAPHGLDVVIDLEVPEWLVLERLASRRVCSVCGANYSTSMPPRVDWTCDLCGGEVVQRADDTEEAIRRRLDAYERQTTPLIEYYRERELLEVVDGVGGPEEVMERILEALARHGVVEEGR